MNRYEEINIRQRISERDPFTVDRYKQFFKFMPKNVCFVLDVGCNTGRGGRTLKQLSKNMIVSGLDIVKDRLERLPKDIYQHNLYGPSTDIPVRDCKFDAVVAGEFIEHLYPADVDKTLAEFFRVLKVGGKILLTTPNPGDIKRRIRKQTVLGGAHLSQHFHNSLKLKLKMFGFNRVKIYGSGKVTRYIGCRFPFLALYGSYLITGEKF